MGLFDDLVPRAKPQRASMFADLIPQEEEAPRLPQMDAGVPTTDPVAPAVQDERTSSVSRRDARIGLGGVEVSQPISDLGKRAARGATEVVAGVPEALGIMQSGGVEARIKDTEGGIGVRQEQIDSITQRLADPTISASERQFREQQLADLQQGQEAISGQMDTFRDRAAISTQERPIYQLGDRIRDRSAEVFGAPDQQFDDRFVSKLAEGGGNLLGFAATTALTGWLGGAATGAALNSSSLYREAIDSGATEEEARRAAAIGAAIGTTEVVPIGRALDRFTGKAKSRLTGAISRRLASALETAGEEGVQEAAVQIANNLTAAGIYDPDRQWNEGALEAAAIGAVLGGGLGALTPAPVTPRSRDDDDRERMDSPRLTPDDRSSPIPNDIIDDGKAIVDELLSGAAPVTPLDQAAPNVRLPDVDVVQRPLPTDRLSPALGAPPQADVAPAAPDTPALRLSEPMEDIQSPGRMVRINLDTGEVVPEAAEVQASPVQQPAPPAQGRNLSEPMEDSQSGQMVQVDLDTGETVQQPRSVDAQATPEPVPTENVAVPEVADPVSPIPVAPTEAPARPTVSRERLKRRPLTDLLKVEGVQPGSPLATELAARGIDQRTTPGLFKAGGRVGWDNLPVSEWSEFAPIVGQDDNGYLSRDGLIEAVENEMRGQPVQVGEQARLQEARDLREYAAEFDDDMPPIDLSDIPEATITIPALEEDISTDAERRQMVERSVNGMLQQTGLTEILTASERAEVTSTLATDGGNVEDMLWSVILRSADDVATEDSFAAAQQRPAQADTQDGVGEAAPAIQQGAERPVSERGAEGGSQARPDNAGRADEGQAEVSADPREEFSAAKAEFDRLNADRQIEDADAYFAASRRLSAARTGLADKLAEEGGRIELANSQGNGATITPTGDGYQISYFDNRGFSGDTRHDTLQAAVRDAIGQGYDTESPGLLKQKQKGADWQSPAKTERARRDFEERTSAPSEPATEQTDAGEQTVMPGVAPITEQDRQRNELERRANAPMAGRDFGPGSGRDDLFGAPEDRRDLFDAPQSNVGQETSTPEINEVEAEPAEIAEPDQETPADMGKAAAVSGDDRRPPADMSSEDTTAWLTAFDAEVQRQIAESKAASVNSGGKVIEGQPKVKVAEYKPAPNAPTLQEPQTAQPMDDRAREMARLAKVADKLEDVGRRAIEKANEDINAPRQENTARRARMAGNAVADAAVRLRNGETAVQIAEAMRSGEADALETVRSIKDIERIDAELKSAQYERLRDAGGRVSNAGPPTEADLANVKAPSLLVRQGEITSLLDATKGKRGVDRRALQGMEGRSLDGFMRVKGRDADVIEAALKVAKKSGPLAYGLKNMADDITKYRALERMVGDDPQGFYGKYLEVRSGATVQPDPLKAVRRSLIGNKIPGFFETPEALAQRMVEEAGISQGDRVLEPSGGLGRIATKLAEAAGKENVTVLEINPTLNSALREQGFNVVGSDFMEFENGGFDAIVMNPPFEKRQDAEHVMRAHELVKPGGRVVAIMGEGVFFGSDAKAVEFRKWLDDLGGTSEKLPEGTFKESGTGVNTRIVMFDKAAAKPKRLFEDKPAGSTVMGLGGLDTTQVPAAEKIQDFGEKIGGARKDTAESTGSRGSRSSTDNRPAWRKRYAVMENWDLKASDADKSKFMILDTKTNRPVRDGFRTKLFEAREAAEAAIPLYEVARNHKVYADGENGFRIARQVSDRKRPTIKTGFASRDEATAYMAANAVEIIETKTRIDDSIHPALEQAIRVGEERRAGGRDVVAQDFGDIFGFRGVEFGNWNNGPERQHILNQAYDAFLDMAEIVGVPPKALSLNGELALAFGARGQGLSSAKAHYERNHATINLTKIKGAGSLAHEWWHAADHYLSRLDGKASSERIEKTATDKDGKPYTYWVFDAKDAKTDYASWGFLYKSGMRQELQDAIKGVMDAISKRKVEFVEDRSTRERIAERRMGSVDQLLKQWRDGLATEQSYGRKTAPATEAQLKRFDKAADMLRKGDLGEMVNAPTKSRYPFRFYGPILEIAEINKEVRGRQAYGLQQNRLTGDAVRLQNAIEARKQDEQFLEDAKAQKVKEKTVRSEYYSNSWAIDQGQSTDYWSTNHELAARAFESFVYDRLKQIDARNDFLAYEKHNDLPEYRMFNVKPYPEGQERADINAAFEKLFDVMETTTNTDDGAVMMYQRPLDMFYSPLLKAVDSAKQKQAPAQDWKAIVAKMPGVKKAELEWLGVDEWLDAQEGQVSRDALVGFIRDSQIEIVEDRQTEDGPERGEFSEYDAEEALGDDLILQPDFRIETGEADWPDDEFFAQEAEVYLDDAREELEDRLDEDESAEDISDADIQERAEEIARERYEPSNYSARLYNYEDDEQSGAPQEYEGWYDSDMREYFFPTLSDDNLDETDASRLAHAPIEALREKQIEEKLKEMTAERDARIAAESEGRDFAITGKARFNSYTEDGGENYREVLLRVPNLHESGKNNPGVSPGAISAATINGAARGMSASEMLSQQEGREVSLKRPFVQSAHFEQENIVVHARVKDRTGPNGERVLFVEEIQSDLASVWRENSEAPEVTARRRELDQEYRRLRNEISDLSDAAAERLKPDADPALSVGNISEDINSVSAVPTRDWSGSKARTLELMRDREPELLATLTELHDRAGDAQRELLSIGTEKRMPEGTPDTPFQQEHTYNLMVKRLLRMAAEEGYDQLSWTPGYMQAERWNSAAQSVVEGVEWDSAEIPGYRYVNIQMASGGQLISASVEPSGRIEGSTGLDLEGKQLSSLVGPSLAKQIMTEQSGRADNQKITFPDSGYAIAYDQQTRKAVDKLVKKHGTSVRLDKSMPDFEQGLGALINEAAKLPKAEILSRFDMLIADIMSRGDQSMTEGRRRLQQEALDRRRQNLVNALDAGEVSYGLQAFSDNDLKTLFPEFAQSLSNPVWSVTITDDLREAAMQPMPMFRRGDTAQQTKAAIWANLPKLRAELNKMGLTDVNLQTVDPDPTYQGALRIDRKGGMTVLIGASLDPAATLRHEAIHALSAMDLFKGGEWRLLTQRAQRDWMAKHDIEARYPELSRLEQIEEAIAEEYAAWAGGSKEKIGAFEKIRKFLEALGNMLRGQGFQTVEDVFGSVSEGVVGNRNRATSQEGMRFQRPNPNAAGREAIARGTNTPMIPDRQVFDEALRDNSAILARASGVKGAVRDNLDNVRLAIQDRMLPLRRAEEAVAELTGNVIDKKDSAYFAEERYSGRVGFRLDAIRDEFTNPIARLIGGAGKKLSLTDPKGETVTGTDAADLYLWARHAKERNARISKINPSMGGPTLEDPYATGTGSGLTDAQADAIIAQAEKSLARKTYRDIGAMADKLGQDMIKWREDAGLLSKEEAAIWRAMYKHYVPLRGFAETDMHDAIANEVQIGSGGSKYGARGKESKTAMGRRSQAYSPLSTMLAMAEEVTVRAEKNLVARTLYNLAEKHPAPAMWRIKTPETKRYFNSATGTVETRVVDPASVMPKPNEVALKINGIEKRVELIDPGMAQAMSQLGTMEMGAVTRFASMFSRLFSATNTMLSPPFVIVNAFRDMVTAQINLGQLPKELRGKVRTAAVRDWMKSFGGSYSEMRGGGSSEYAQYFKEFSAVGAKVSFWKIENPEARSDELRKAVRRESGGVLNQMFWKNATVDTDVNPVLNWIETVNLAVDNSVRLSVYVEARKQGVSIEEAASLSKNLTVNFNRRGEWGATMNAWFPFANAAVQGSHVLVKAMKAPQVQALLGGAILTGFAMELLNASLSEEDEDGELAHDKIPDYISQRNLIVPTGTQSRVTIPLPYGYNVFFYAGQQMAKAVRGVKDEGRVIGDVTKATFGAFSPISGEGIAQTIMPTLGDHMMELATNKDWLGRPIRPESPYSDFGPQAYKMFKNEPPAAFQFASDMMNKGTGGNELEPGLIDVSPEYLHHTFKFLTGGAGRFVDQTIDLGTKIATGDADLVEAHQIPLVRTLRYKPSEFLDQGRYFEFRTKVNSARAMVEKRAPELGIDPTDALVKTSRLYPQLRAAERQRRAISERMDTIYADSTLSFRDRRERLAPLEEMRQEVYIRFNQAYVQAMGPQAE